MIRRIPWRTLFLGALCLVPTGCEPHKSWLRPKDDDDMMAKAADSQDSGSSSKVIGSSPDDKDSSSFFSDTRRSGGLSSEARAIERDLGAF